MYKATQWQDERNVIAIETFRVRRDKFEFGVNGGATNGLHART